MESLFALFAFGTLWFWIAVLGFIVTITVFSEESGVKATVTLVLGAVFLQYIAKWDLISLIRYEPFTLALYALLYVAIGFVFAGVKWWRYAKRQRRRYDQFRVAFFKKRGIVGEVIPAGDKKAFAKDLQSYYKPNQHGFQHHYDSEDADPIIPDITKNKAAYIRWMTYWPVNAVFTLLNDPVRRLFEWVYEVAGKKMQEIANSVFAGTERDRFTEEDEAELDRRERSKNPYPAPDDPGDSRGGGARIRRTS